MLQQVNICQSCTYAGCCYSGTLICDWHADIWVVFPTCGRYWSDRRFGQNIWEGCERAADPNQPSKCSSLPYATMQAAGTTIFKPLIIFPQSARQSTVGSVRSLYDTEILWSSWHPTSYHAAYVPPLFRNFFIGGRCWSALYSASSWAQFYHNNADLHTCYPQEAAWHPHL